jgi:hypothetical protein
MKLFDLSNFNLVLSFLKSRGVHGSVRFGFYQKKITKLILKKKKTETEPKLVQTDQFWFGFLEKKPVWLGFFGLARFFRFDSVLARFFSGFFSGSVWFFRFQA